LTPAPPAPPGPRRPRPRGPGAGAPTLSLSDLLCSGGSILSVDNGRVAPYLASTVAAALPDAKAADT
jgi:hypothetical protein